ncbi:MAG: magnesium and cobalt transport protein CorA [Acidobacteria bacterium]|nr:MAG: magnesium and cobalt transport protein CorA [Acidobacteriota bacterium]
MVGRVVSRSKKPIGAPPGVLVYPGERKAEPVVMRIFKYDSSTVQEDEWTADQLPEKYARGQTATWIDVTGLHDVETLKRIGDAFSIHPLVLEDILTPGQRAKSEEYEGLLVIVLKDVDFDRTSMVVGINQVTIILGDHFIISFRDRPTDLFEPVRERLRNGRGQIRKRGVDYLAYALVDCIVDKYFRQLEAIGEETDELEEAVTGSPDAVTMQRLHALRREMLVFRKAVWPVREAVGALHRSDNPLITRKTAVYFRDVYDHSVQILDIIETLREVLSGMMDLYLSSVSNRMNETMKVLTIIATIFIPLSFIAGVYGMNFQYMPELRMRWAYPAVLGLMIFVGAGMLWYFRRKKWL